MILARRPAELSSFLQGSMRWKRKAGAPPGSKAPSIAETAADGRSGAREGGTPNQGGKKFLASGAGFPQHPGKWFAGSFRNDMKAKIIITPKKAVLDPQGKTVQTALEHMGYQGIGAVHVGKYLEIEVTGDLETVRKQIDEACHKILSNPVIEDYKFQIE